MTDHRHTHRIKLSLPVCFQDPKQKEVLAISTTLDISVSGLALVTKEPLEPGQEIALNVELPDAEMVYLDVKVVRVEPRVQMAQLGGYKEFLIGLRINEPLTAGAKKFVHFYAQQLKQAEETKHDEDMRPEA
jgi:hypothetical protein